MIYLKKAIVFNVKTFTAGAKSVVANAIKGTKKSAVKFVDLKATIKAAADSTSAEADRKAAIALLNDKDAFFYCNVTKAECSEICKLAESLDFRDFIPSSFFSRSADGSNPKETLVIRQVHDGKEVLVKDAVANATYSIHGGDRVEFHVQFTYTSDSSYVEAARPENAVSDPVTPPVTPTPSVQSEVDETPSADDAEKEVTEETSEEENQ